MHGAEGCCNTRVVRTLAQAHREMRSPCEGRDRSTPVRDGSLSNPHPHAAAMSSSHKYTPGPAEGATEPGSTAAADSAPELSTNAAASAPIDAQQVDVEIDDTQQQSKGQRKHSKASSSTAAASASKSSSAASSSSMVPHHAQTNLSTLAAQITPACHVTPPDGSPDSAGNVFVHVIESVQKQRTAQWRRSRRRRAKWLGVSSKRACMHARAPISLFTTVHSDQRCSRCS